MKLDYSQIITQNLVTQPQTQANPEDLQQKFKIKNFQIEALNFLLKNLQPDKPGCVLADDYNFGKRYLSILVSYFLNFEFTVIVTDDHLIDSWCSRIDFFESNLSSGDSSSPHFNLLKFSKNLNDDEFLQQLADQDEQIQKSHHPGDDENQTILLFNFGNFERYFDEISTSILDEHTEHNNVLLIVDNSEKIMTQFGEIFNLLSLNPQAFRQKVFLCNQIFRLIYEMENNPDRSFAKSFENLSLQKSQARAGHGASNSEAASNESFLDLASTNGANQPNFSLKELYFLVTLIRPNLNLSYENFEQSFLAPPEPASEPNSSSRFSSTSARNSRHKKSKKEAKHKKPDKFYQPKNYQKILEKNLKGIFLRRSYHHLMYHKSEKFNTETIIFYQLSDQEMQTYAQHFSNFRKLEAEQ